MDTRKTKMYKLYGEKREEIEGQSTKLEIFVDKQAENEGIDVCASCFQEKIVNLLTATDNTPAWKGITWNEVRKVRKDGTPYTRNEKTVATIEEITERIKAEKAEKAKVAPTVK